VAAAWSCEVGALASESSVCALVPPAENENDMPASVGRVVAARSGVGRLGAQARAEHVAQLGDLGQKVSDRPVPAVTADVDRLQGGLLQVRVGDQVHDVGLAVLLGLAADVALQLVRLVYVEGHSRSAYRLRGGVWAKTTVSYSSHSHAV